MNAASAVSVDFILTVWGCDLLRKERRVGGVLEDLKRLSRALYLSTD